jgi:adenylylsulfate kinase-like enzyme
MKKIDKNRGILFWVTGLSGSGKTVIAEKIKKDVTKNYGPTILVSGDDLRKIFKFNKYTAKERKVLGKYYCNFAKIYYKSEY